jgi:hypothetical protein
MLEAELPAAASCSISQLYLAAHVFVSVGSDGAILLDLRRNKYLGIAMPEATVLALLVDGWPASPAEKSPTLGSSDPRIRELIQSLRQAKILQSSPAVHRIGSRSSLDGDLRSVGDEIFLTTTVRFGHVARFALGLLTALVFLRLLPLRHTARIVHDRKRRALDRGYCFNERRAQELTYVFRLLRPYFFTANGHCMLHALSLIQFLAHQGEFPCWVMGVRTQPWGAHSWVQQGELLFDTNPAKVCPYDPILSI